MRCHLSGIASYLVNSQRTGKTTESGPFIYLIFYLSLLKKISPEDMSIDLEREEERGRGRGGGRERETETERGRKGGKEGGKY